MHLHPMYHISNMEFPKVLFLNHYSFQFTLMTYFCSSSHVVNCSRMTQQSIAVTLISKSYPSHYNLSQWAEFNHISLHVGQAKFMFITTRQKRPNLTFSYPPISNQNQTVNKVDYHKILDVAIGWYRSWSVHVTVLRKGT